MGVAWEKGTYKLVLRTSLTHCMERAFSEVAKVSL